MRIYSHLKHQLTNYQVNAVLGAHNFSYLEGRVSYCSIEQKMYVRRLLLCTEYTGAHHWYRRRASGVPNEIRDVLVQETRFWCTKWNKRCVGTGNALLVYQRGQDISFGPVEGNCGRTVGVIPDSHPSTLGAALSFQIQTTIIPGEKMVVIHPGRHH